MFFSRQFFFLSFFLFLSIQCNNGCCIMETEDGLIDLTPLKDMTFVGNEFYYYDETHQVTVSFCTHMDESHKCSVETTLKNGIGKDEYSTSSSKECKYVGGNVSKCSIYGYDARGKSYFIDYPGVLDSDGKIRSVEMKLRCDTFEQNVQGSCNSIFPSPSTVNDGASTEFTYMCGFYGAPFCAGYKPPISKRAVIIIVSCVGAGFVVHAFTCLFCLCCLILATHFNVWDVLGCTKRTDEEKKKKKKSGNKIEPSAPNQNYSHHHQVSSLGEEATSGQVDGFGKNVQGQSNVKFGYEERSPLLINGIEFENV